MILALGISFLFFPLITQFLFDLKATDHRTAELWTIHCRLQMTSFPIVLHYHSILTWQYLHSDFLLAHIIGHHFSFSQKWYHFYFIILTPLLGVF